MDMHAHMPPHPSDAQIVLRDVHLAYPAPSGREEALRGVTLSIPVGEHVCVLGANGSGKSTLVELIDGLLTPTSGDVEVMGLSTAVPEERVAIRRHVGVVFQDPGDQMVTSVVADDVAFGPENLGIPAPEIVRRVEGALAAVGLERFARADPADLSGGQKQRVAIAGAIAMEPEILLLDEPCAMLDAEGRDAVRNIITHLHERGVTVVHVTHDMEDAVAADRVVVLDRGRIALSGTPDRVFSEPDVLERLGLELPFAAQLARDLARRTPAFDGLPAAIDAKGLARLVAERLRASTPCEQRRRPETAEVRATVTSVDDGGQGGENAVAFSHVSFSYADERPARKRPGILVRRHRERRVPPLAIDDVTLTVPRGSLTAIVGHTGAGKSTVLELACALRLPRTGTVSVGGIDTADLGRRRALRAQVGYVAQLPDRQLFASTVFDDVAFGPRNLGLAEEEVSRRVEDALSLVGLGSVPGLLDRSPFALSGGQRRAVALAGVLALRTPVLVLDEPMAGLDPQGRRRMRALFDRLRALGTTLIMVTHDMDDAAELADRVIALREGRIVGADAPEAVFRSRHVDAIPHALAFCDALADAGTPLPEEALTIEGLAELIVREVSRGAAR